MAVGCPKGGKNQSKTKRLNAFTNKESSHWNIKF